MVRVRQFITPAIQAGMKRMNYPFESLVRRIVHRLGAHTLPGTAGSTTAPITVAAAPPPTDTPKGQRSIMTEFRDEATIHTLENTPVQPYYATDLQLMLSERETGGKFYMSRSRHLNPEDAPPLHRHSREDEIWFVHSGTVRFFIGGDSLATATRHDVPAGGVVYGPRGTAHTFMATERGADVTIMTSPGDIEQFFLSTEAADERRDGDHLDKFAAYGIEILDRAPTLAD